MPKKVGILPWLYDTFFLLKLEVSNSGNSLYYCLVLNGGYVNHALLSWTLSTSMVNAQPVQRVLIRMVREPPAQSVNQMKKWIMMGHVNAVLMVLFLMKIEDFANAALKT